MGKGTTLSDPVTVEQKPDLVASRHEIEEYLQEQNAYDIFDFLLKELMTKQPADPLQHMLECLQTQHPSGPLRVAVAGPPGIGRPALCKRLAETFGLVYISAGELLEQAGVKTEEVGLADDDQVSKLVVAKLREASQELKGWVLDGFPRTCYQASFLTEECMVPVHVSQLLAGEAYAHELNQRIADGEVQGRYVKPDVLKEKLRLFSCHNTAAFEAYSDRMFTIDAQQGAEAAFAELALRVRSLPRSRGPRPPARVVLLGSGGADVPGHAAKLAVHLGAVMVDADYLQASRGKQRSGDEAPPGGDGRGRVHASLDLPNAAALAAADPLGLVGVRLRQGDCAKQGWVLCGSPSDAASAAALHEDPLLRPTRVAVLARASDAASAPHRAALRAPVAGGQAFGDLAHCAEIAADGPPAQVFAGLVDFVERPLPLPAPGG